jgi:hypothetical protein
MNYLKHNGFNVIDNTVVNDRITSVTFYLRALQNFPEGINIYSDFELFKSFIPQSE